MEPGRCENLDKKEFRIPDKKVKDKGKDRLLSQWENFSSRLINITTKLTLKQVFSFVKINTAIGIENLGTDRSNCGLSLAISLDIKVTWYCLTMQGRKLNIWRMLVCLLQTSRFIYIYRSFVYFTTVFVFRTMVSVTETKEKELNDHQYR